MSDTNGNALTTAITPNITFLQIPENIEVPGNYIEIDVNNSNVGLLPYPARFLAIGQMAATGINAVAGKVYPTITTPAQAANLFGAVSPITDIVTNFLKTNPGIPCDAIGLAAASGSTAAAGSFTFSAAATTVQAQAVGVAGNRITFTISPGDTPTTMAENFVAAAEAYAELVPLPVTFAAAAGVVTVTAAIAGIFGNYYDLRINPAQGDITVPGVAIAVVPMTGGTGAPTTLGTTLASVATTWYTDMVVQWNDQVSQNAVAAYLAEQSNAMVSLDGVEYTVWTGTQGQIASLADTIDSQFIAGLGITNPQNPFWVIAATLAGVAAFNLMNDPARQLRGLVLPGIIAPAPADQITTETEQNALLLDGVGTYEVTQDGSVVIQRLVTTYTTSPLGVPDQSWQDIMSVKVMSRIRWDWKNYLSLVYPNYKLADDGSMAAEYNSNVVTCKLLKGAWAARCSLYEKAGWIQNSAATAQASLFVRDPNNRNKVNCQLQVQVIGNLMITAQSLQFDVEG